MTSSVTSVSLASVFEIFFWLYVSYDVIMNVSLCEKMNSSAVKLFYENYFLKMSEGTLRGILKHEVLNISLEGFGGGDWY